MFPTLTSCAIQADPNSAADFREATAGAGVKALADWMGVAPSQITRWRYVGNVPDSRLRRLPPDVLRRYRELQAARDGVVVLEGRTIANALEMLNGMLSACGWRPAMVKASLAPALDAGALSGRGKVA